MGAKIKYNDSYSFKEEVNSTDDTKKKKKLFSTKRKAAIKKAAIAAVGVAGLGAALYPSVKDSVSAYKKLQDFNKEHSPAYKARKRKKAYDSIERRINQKPKGREFNNTVDVKYTRVS